jgi:hypothetical protein
MRDKLKLKIGEYLFESNWYAREEGQRPNYYYSSYQRAVLSKSIIQDEDGKRITYNITGIGDIDASMSLESYNLFTTKKAADEGAKQLVIKALKGMKRIDTTGYTQHIALLKARIKTANNPKRTKRFADAIKYLYDNLPKGER